LEVCPADVSAARSSPLDDGWARPPQALRLRASEKAVVRRRKRRLVTVTASRSSRMRRDSTLVTLVEHERPDILAGP
jgi:hypothetical protein